jgi:hypothetical protein
VKLLFDENVSHTLVRGLASEYPGPRDADTGLYIGDW